MWRNNINIVLLWFFKKFRVVIKRIERNNVVNVKLVYCLIEDYIGYVELGYECSFG